MVFLLISNALATSTSTRGRTGHRFCMGVVLRGGDGSGIAGLAEVGFVAGEDADFDGLVGWESGKSDEAVRVFWNAITGHGMFLCFAGRWYDSDQLPGSATREGSNPSATEEIWGLCEVFRRGRGLGWGSVQHARRGRKVLTAPKRNLRRGRRRRSATKMTFRLCRRAVSASARGCR